MCAYDIDWSREDRFKGPPKDAALLIFTIEEDTVDGDGEEAADA
jgi:hypothetical protein